MIRLGQLNQILYVHYCMTHHSCRVILTISDGGIYLGWRTTKNKHQLGITRQHQLQKSLGPAPPSRTTGNFAGFLSTRAKQIAPCSIAPIKSLRNSHVPDRQLLRNAAYEADCILQQKLR